MPIEATNLNIEAIRSNLHKSAVGHTIFYYPTIPSTMPVAHTLADDSSIRSGTLVLTEEQTEGRGRLARNWHSPFGKAILLSLLLRNEQIPAQPVTLMMIAGIVAVEAITKLAPDLSGQCGLKWPNDILLGKERTHPQKVGGILIESRRAGTERLHSVVGVGINANQPVAQLAQVQSKSLPPTSIYAYLGRPVDRSELIVEIGRLWAHYLQQCYSDEMAIFEKWRAYLWTIGQEVDILDAGEVVHSGLVLDVNSDGSLLLDTGYGRNYENREVQAVYVGDVSLRYTAKSG